MLNHFAAGFISRRLFFTGIYMATRLPSGNYRTQVLVGYENGRRKYKSFTAETAKKANLAALQWQSEHPSANTSEATLSSAMESFIKPRKTVLSPSTIRGYCAVQLLLASIGPMRRGEIVGAVSCCKIVLQHGGNIVY